MSDRGMQTVRLDFRGTTLVGTLAISRSGTQCDRAMEFVSRIQEWYLGSRVARHRRSGINGNFRKVVPRSGRCHGNQRRRDTRIFCPRGGKASLPFPLLSRSSKSILYDDPRWFTMIVDREKNGGTRAGKVRCHLIIRESLCNTTSMQRGEIRTERNDVVSQKITNVHDVWIKNLRRTISVLYNMLIKTSDFEEIHNLR